MNKLCKDCAWFQPDTFGWLTPELQLVYARCGRTSVIGGVDGTRCKIERSRPVFLFASCGKRARFFIAKEPNT